jgi:hypothetical protein
MWYALYAATLWLGVAIVVNICGKGLTRQGATTTPGRKLGYANCGHLPLLLLCARADDRFSGTQKVERLEATSMIVGLFDEW